jgi:DNA-binding phage protein
MYRTKSFDAYVSKQLRSRNAARGFVLSGQLEGESLQESVADLVRTYGIKEFVNDYGLSRSAVYRLLEKKGNFYATIVKILEKLKLDLWAVDSKKQVEMHEKAA